MVAALVTSIPEGITPHQRSRCSMPWNSSRYPDTGCNVSGVDGRRDSPHAIVHGSVLH
ncbi:hypothetical protein CEXT_455501, partial [Caerostris extrusa]